MGYYDSEINVEKYIEMSKDYNNQYIVKMLKNYLPEGSTILELGMGPGKDMELLSKSYYMTGTDVSKFFLDIYKSNHEDADLMLLDAVTLNTGRKFDCIYSNKVLQHLTRSELKKSIERQVEVLNQGGIVFHTFWYGEGEEKFDDLLFTYYDESDLRLKFEEYFDVVDIKRYQEESENDSILIVCRRKE